MIDPDFSRLADVRRQRPLVHCVANLVAANDCANVALAAGASPVMAEAPPEMPEITAASAATILNTGTPSGKKFRVCRICGVEANRLNRPVVLDPVGVGASAWRLSHVRQLLEAFTPTILRVNLGEAQALACLETQAQGVDAPASDSSRRLDAAVCLSRRYGTAVLLSGPEDFVAGPGGIWRISGGSVWTPQVTGTGCMLSTLCGVFAAAEPDAEAAAVLAAAFWKACARRAESVSRGPGSFRAALMDAAAALTPEMLEAEAKIEKLCPGAGCNPLRRAASLVRTERFRQIGIAKPAAYVILGNKDISDLR